MRLLGFEQLSLRWFNPIMRYKQPRSVQVVIFGDGRHERLYLLLKRIESDGGFWQPVTGSIEGEETHRQAALREVLEETGIRAHDEELIELGVVNTFEIAPQWRDRYAPGVTHNEEVCFALEVSECEVRVDSMEHESYIWVGLEQAMEMVFWESNKGALAATGLLNR